MSHLTTKKKKKLCGWLADRSIKLTVDHMIHKYIACPQIFSNCYQNLNVEFSTKNRYCKMRNLKVKGMNFILIINRQYPIETRQ